MSWTCLGKYTPVSEQPRRFSRAEMLAALAELRKATADPVDQPVFTLRTPVGDFQIKSSPAVPPDGYVFLADRRVDPLDAVLDGYTLRQLVSFDDAARRENVIAQCTRKCFTPAQRAAVQAHWSAQLRAKVDASAAADRARQPSVMVELDDP